MHYTHTAPKTNGKLAFLHQEAAVKHRFQEKMENDAFLTIAMNLGEKQQIEINGLIYDFPENSIVPLVSGQIFKMERSEKLTLWQYTREFYCLLENYFEISCLGYLFFGFNGTLFLKLDEDARRKLLVMQQLFVEEFDTNDTIQTEMLQVLLKRLVIITTRLAKEQYLYGKVYEEERFDIIRQFNTLVDQHFRKEHQVQYYADMLNKSPKTLANVFAQFDYHSPSTAIQERIVLEAKRLFHNTRASVKEIAYELGFSDAGHFSRFFKNATGQSPKQLRNGGEKVAINPDESF
jgi:AraC family transcriptional activator of pobA